MWFCWVLTWQHSAHLQYHEPDLRLALFVVKSCKRNSWGDFSPPGFQLYPCCPGWGLVWGIPPSKPGSLISPDHVHTHVTVRLGFPKGLKLTGPASFWWGGSAGKSWWEQQASIAEHLELRVLHKHSLAGCRAWRTWQGVTCHPGTSHRVQLVCVAVCLYRKSSCGSKSWL